MACILAHHSLHSLHQSLAIQQHQPLLNLAQIKRSFRHQDKSDSDRSISYPAYTDGLAGHPQ